MKIGILSLFLLTSFGAFAQVHNSAMSVCESIRRVTAYPERVTQCMTAVSRASFDPKVIPLLTNLSDQSTIEVLNSLAVAANANFDAGAISVCDAIRVATAYPERVTQCLKISANKSYSQELTALAVRTTNNSTLEANNILILAPSAYFMPQALAACEAIRTITAYPERVTSCVSAIKNKTFMNGTETFCAQMAKTNTVETIKCLEASAITYVPAPPARTDLLISAAELRSLKVDLMKARSQVERGMTAQALQTLGDAIRTVETVEANN